MKFDFMSAFVGFFLLMGAVWMPIFIFLSLSIVLGYYDPKNNEQRNKWKKGTWVAFFSVLLVYIIILRNNGVGLN